MNDRMLGDMIQLASDTRLAESENILICSFLRICRGMRLERSAYLPQTSRVGRVQQNKPSMKKRGLIVPFEDTTTSSGPQILMLNMDSRTGWVKVAQADVLFPPSDRSSLANTVAPVTLLDDNRTNVQENEFFHFLVKKMEDFDRNQNPKSFQFASES
jgi:hypothetical protein